MSIYGQILDCENIHQVAVVVLGWWNAEIKVIFLFTYLYFLNFL